MDLERKSLSSVPVLGGMWHEPVSIVAAVARQPFQMKVAVACRVWLHRGLNETFVCSPAGE